MNFLAHAHLSFNHPQILLGNIISDFVKGKKQYDYPDLILKGIKLHRAIDNFTDTHQATKEIKLIFKPQYGLYAGAFVDVVYDYFLANDNTQFMLEENLNQFAQQTYTTLTQNIPLLPEAFNKMLPYMIEQNWLYHYKNKAFIQKSFIGLVRRATYLAESDIAFALFHRHEAAIKNLYNNFYPDVKKFALGHLQYVLNQ